MQESSKKNTHFEGPFFEDVIISACVIMYKRKTPRLHFKNSPFYVLKHL